MTFQNLVIAPLLFSGTAVSLATGDINAGARAAFATTLTTSAAFLLFCCPSDLLLMGTLLCLAALAVPGIIMHNTTPKPRFSPF